MRRLACEERGLTLIETLFALGILMFGVLAMFVPMQYGTLSLVHSKNMAVALEIATSRMEEVKIDSHGFFDQITPETDQPPTYIDDPNSDPNSPAVWHHDLLNLTYGEISGREEFASYVILDRTVAPNVAVARLPVVWQRIGGRFSTVDGEPFDPNDPDAHRAFVELTTIVRYR